MKGGCHSICSVVLFKTLLLHTPDRPHHRLKCTEEESGELSTSETQRTMSEETDNSQKDLIQ